MWNHSIVFKCAPLLCSCNTYMVLWVGPKECAFHEVFCEVGGFFGCFESIFVFLEPYGEAPAGLSHIHLITVGDMSTCIHQIVSVCRRSADYALAVFV